MFMAQQKESSDHRRILDEFRKVSRAVKMNEPMSKHTTIGAGGPVRFFALPRSPREVVGLVRRALAWGVDYLAVGRGSNLLVRDGGYDGLVIKIANNLSGIELRKRTVYAEAGVSFTRLGRMLTRQGRAGFEFAIGIPGCVGGAVRMNAGAFGSDIARVLKSVRVVDESGDTYVLKPEQLAFRYRGSALPPRAIVLSAIFKSPPGKIDKGWLEQSLGRKKTQPLEFRSFGSTFVNPPGGFAAQMIEQCGLKGKGKGGAVISEKHANFILNRGEHTRANDIEDLINTVIERVREKFGVTLEPEVIIIGDR
jgi:UDP-N-acetylmuramate dehydrogenase